MNINVCCISNQGIRFTNSIWCPVMHAFKLRYESLGCKVNFDYLNGLSGCITVCTVHVMLRKGIVIMMWCDVWSGIKCKLDSLCLLIKCRRLYKISIQFNFRFNERLIILIDGAVEQRWISMEKISLLPLRGFLINFWYAQCLTETANLLWNLEAEKLFSTRPR